MILLAALLQSQPRAVVVLVVTSGSGPVARAQVVVHGTTSETGQDGRITLQFAPGDLQITVVKEGFNPVTVSATAVPGPPQVIAIRLEPQTAIEEAVTVSATR